MNARRLRAVALDYVHKRKNGQCQSKVGQEADVLTLMMQSPDIFTEAVIVDELMDFFLAAS